MRSLILALSLPLLLSCTDDTQDKPPREDFRSATAVRITAPGNGDTVDSFFTLQWEAGEDVASLVLMEDTRTVREIEDNPGKGQIVVQLDEGTHPLSLRGLDADGETLSSHEITVRVDVDDAQWVTISSPADGSTVTNPVTFTVATSTDVAEVELWADGWSLGTTRNGLLTYDFDGTGFVREIVAEGMDADGDVIAEHTVQITVDDGTNPNPSSYSERIAQALTAYPTDGSYGYYWPSTGDWGGNPHDIYYQDRLWSEGDDQNRSFCVGMTIQVFMDVFEDVDAEYGLDGSLNGIEFDELYDFRTDWYVRELYGRGIVDAMDNYGIGDLVSDWTQAQPGDIVQFWRHSGSGHNAVFIDWETDGQGAITGFNYWSTQGSTDGIGYNSEYFGASGSAVDPAFTFIGRVRMPEDWAPWF